MSKYGYKPLAVENLDKVLDDQGRALVDIVNEKGQLLLPKGAQLNERIKKMKPHVMVKAHEDRIDFSKFKLHDDEDKQAAEELAKSSKISSGER